MRKKAKIIIFLLVISLAGQYLVYCILEWQTGKLLSPYFRFDKPYSVKEDISGAEEMRLSYNNKYLSYLKGERLAVIDLSRNELVFKSEPPDHSSKLIGYKWLPDRNSLLYLINKNQEGSYSTVLYSLDLDSYLPDAEYSLQINRNFGFFMGKIYNLEISTYTNNLYILYDDENHKKRLLKLDIMKNINWLDLPGETIFNISVSNKFGTLYLTTMSASGKAVISAQGTKRKIITADIRDTLLGCTDSTVYIGRYSGGILQEIHFLEENNNLRQETGKQTVIWEGELLSQSSEIFLTPDKKVLLKSENRLDIISSDGEHKQVKTSSQPIVLATSGNAYLEIKQTREGFLYYWRSIN